MNERGNFRFIPPRPLFLSPDGAEIDLEPGKEKRICVVAFVEIIIGFRLFVVVNLM